MKRIIFSLSLIFLMSGTATAKWHMSVYHAVLAGPGIEDAILLSAEFDTSYRLIAFTLGKQIYQYNENIVFELEAQAVQHLGDQTHSEWNGVFIARWLTFPWNHVIPTTFAFGEGLSYATQTPNIEALHNETVSHFLNYLSIEFTFTLPHIKHFHLLTRVHHRSGAYGLFNDVKGASNAVGAGLRYEW
ncbi:MAG: hypothetical protein OMM_00212 [Candidatus Magnetoglobus multicellularis str. Araruama]|uniref:Acyloxyacyl hydrolase n=1 Tax=Candidatus Magnetoglobus multicellularis str. Araruama TaxID=890399 RepID=A0A1V1PI44_9BACT|nr:MAG: hypothetical protein OMM_00212 [Candidatus Magnetoglobus multicellularis str. Araruama]